MHGGVPHLGIGLGELIERKQLFGQPSDTRIDNLLLGRSQNHRHPALTNSGRHLVILLRV